MRLKVAALVVMLVPLGLVPAGFAGAAQAAQATQGSQAISIHNTAYHPSPVTIVAGWVVTWTNSETRNEPHSVTSDTGAFDSSPTNCGGSGGTGCIQPGGGTYQFTFNTPGTYAYHCRVHGYMHGSIEVETPMPGVQVVRVSPNAFAVGVGKRATIIGQNFTTGATVSFSGTGIHVGPTTIVSGTTLTVNVNVARTAAIGARDVTVTDPAGGGSGTCTGCFTLDPRPTATAASPSSLPQSTNATVNLTGSGFTSATTVQAIGNEFQQVLIIGETLVSSTKLRLNVVVLTGAPTGIVDLRVTNPDGGTADCKCLTVTPVVTVTGLSPNALARGSHTKVTISGTGFQAGAGVSFSGTGVTAGPTTFVSGTTITANVRVASSAATGLRDVTVQNPISVGGDSGVCTGCLTVQ